MKLTTPTTPPIKRDYQEQGRIIDPLFILLIFMAAIGFLGGSGSREFEIDKQRALIHRLKATIARDELLIDTLQKEQANPDQFIVHHSEIKR